MDDCLKILLSRFRARTSPSPLIRFFPSFRGHLNSISGDPHEFEHPTRKETRINAILSFRQFVLAAAAVANLEAAVCQSAKHFWVSLSPFVAGYNRTAAWQQLSEDEGQKRVEPDPGRVGDFSGYLMPVPPEVHW